MTLHVDRPNLDRRLFDLARQLGTEFVWDSVSSVDVAGEHVVGCRTLGGGRIAGRWFVDASGQARLLARRFQIPKVEYGARKVCLWTYFDTPPHAIRTTLYGDTAAAEYVTWVWEIPITPERTSVGCVMAAERFRRERARGKKPREILREDLLRYPRFHALVGPAATLDVTACSYRSYVHTRVSGPNWFLAGEAASLPDPLTANGVTAAFRHGLDAAALIVSGFDRGAISASERYPYEANVRRMGHAFNHSIETGIYEWPVRCGVGSLPAQKVYTAFSYSINALYSKFQPQSRLRVEAFGLLLKGVWLWFEVWALIGRAGMQLRRAGAHRQTVPLRARA